MDDSRPIEEQLVDLRRRADDDYRDATSSICASSGSG
jgi:hypothetical protein